MNVEKETAVGPEGRAELLVNIRRLANILMERLEEGSRERTLDQAQTRMLSGTTLKALRLWQEVLAKDGISDREMGMMRESEKRLTRTTVGLEG